MTTPSHGPAGEYAQVFRAWQACSSKDQYVLRQVLLALDGGRAPAGTSLARLGSEYFELLPDTDASVAAWCEAEYECTLPACGDVRDPEYQDEAGAGEEAEQEEEEEEDEDEDEEQDEDEGEDEDERNAENVGEQGQVARLPPCLARYDLAEAHRAHCLCGKPINNLHVVRHIGTQRVFFVGSHCARSFRAAAAPSAGRAARPKRKCTQRPAPEQDRRVRPRPARAARPVAPPPAGRAAPPGDAPVSEVAQDLARRVLLEIGLALVGLAQRPRAGALTPAPAGEEKREEQGRRGFLRAPCIKRPD